MAAQRTQKCLTRNTDASLAASPLAGNDSIGFGLKFKDRSRCNQNFSCHPWRAAISKKPLLSWPASAGHPAGDMRGRPWARVNSLGQMGSVTWVARRRGP